MPGPRNSIPCSFSRVRRCARCRSLVRWSRRPVTPGGSFGPTRQKSSRSRASRLCAAASSARRIDRLRPALRRPGSDRPAALAEARRPAHVCESLHRSLDVLGEAVARHVFQRARLALARDPDRRRLALHRRARARRAPRGHVSDRPVGSGPEVRGANERIDVVDVHSACSHAVRRLHERDGELAMRGLARNEEVVSAAERNPDLDDGICIASELLGR